MESTVWLGECIDYFIVWILLTKKYLVQNSHKSQSMCCKIPATHRSKSVWCKILATHRSKSVAANKEFNAGFLQRSPQSQLITLKRFIPPKIVTSIRTFKTQTKVWIIEKQLLEQSSSIRKCQLQTGSSQSTLFVPLQLKQTYLGGTSYQVIDRNRNGQD